MEIKKFIYITEKELCDEEIGQEYKEHKKYCKKNRLPLMTITSYLHVCSIKIEAPIKNEEEDELWEDFDDNSFISKMLINMGMMESSREWLEPVCIYNVKPECSEMIADALYKLFLDKKKEVDEIIKYRRENGINRRKRAI